jgi:hypothetical protein
MKKQREDQKKHPCPDCDKKYCATKFDLVQHQIEVEPLHRLTF